MHPVEDADSEVQLAFQVGQRFEIIDGAGKVHFARVRESARLG